MLCTLQVSSKTHILVKFPSLINMTFEEARTDVGLWEDVDRNRKSHRSAVSKQKAKLKGAHEMGKLS